MMSKVRLKFHNVGEIVGSDDLAIITLTDEILKIILMEMIYMTR